MNRYQPRYMGAQHAPCRHMTVVKTAALADCIDRAPLAMAYVPCQCFQKLYDADIALSRGTIFQELDKPFIGEEAVCYG